MARAYWMTSGLRLALAALVIYGLSACTNGTDPCEVPFARPPEEFSNLTIKEGVAGYVFFWEGNFLGLCATGKVTPVVRSVIAYPRLEGSQKEDAGGSFARVPNVEPVDSVWSDAEGFYQISLPPGEYTLVRARGFASLL